MKKITILLVSCMLILLVTGATGAGIYNGPRIKFKNGTSINWSGYAALTSLSSPQSNAVSDVKGSWTIPTVTGTSNTWSSTWIGIDGYSDGTVEQIGTEQDWYNGAPVYRVWYEMYPKMPKAISIAVKPGDIISAEVRYLSSRRFALSIANLTTGKSYGTTQKTSAKRQSAEWIVEAPWSGSTLPLANFGTETFTGASAVLNGHQGSISDPSWKNDPITMTTSSGSVKASPSALSTDGTSFNDTWYSN